MKLVFLVVSLCFCVYANANSEPAITFKDVTNAWNLIKKHSYTSVPEGPIMQETLNAMLQRYNNGTNKKVIFVGGETPMEEAPRAGLGIAISGPKKDDKNTPTIITDVFDDSTGAKAGFKINDRILRIDGLDIATLRTLPEIVSKIVGPIGSTVCLEVLRGAEQKNLCAKREAILAPRFRTTIIGNIGIIEVMRLDKRYTEKDFADALTTFETQSVRTVVIDFRFNETADILSGVQFMNQLLPTKTPLFHVKRAKDNVEKYVTTSERTTKRELKVVVVLSSWAGGMVEVLTHLLKKFYSAKVIGEKSQGNAVVKKLVPLKKNISILIADAEITDVDGVSYTDRPQIPDVHVPNIEQLDLKGLAIINAIGTTL